MATTPVGISTLSLAHQRALRGMHTASARLSLSVGVTRSSLVDSGGVRAALFPVFTNEDEDRACRTCDRARSLRNLVNQYSTL